MRKPSLTDWDQDVAQWADRLADALRREAEASCAFERSEAQRDVKAIEFLLDRIRERGY